MSSWFTMIKRLAQQNSRPLKSKKATKTILQLRVTLMCETIVLFATTPMKTSKDSNLCVEIVFATSVMARVSRMDPMLNASKYAHCDLLLQMYYNSCNDY